MTTKLVATVAFSGDFAVVSADWPDIALDVDPPLTSCGKPVSKFIGCRTITVVAARIRLTISLRCASTGAMTTKSAMQSSKGMAAFLMSAARLSQAARRSLTCSTKLEVFPSALHVRNWAGDLAS